MLWAHRPHLGPQGLRTYSETETAVFLRCLSGDRDVKPGELRCWIILECLRCVVISFCPQHLSGSSGKESACQCRRYGFDPWVRKIPWRREWQPTPIFLPGRSHGQRNLEGYSPWGHKESDTTEHARILLDPRVGYRSSQFLTQLFKQILFWILTKATHKQTDKKGVYLEHWTHSYWAPFPCLMVPIPSSASSVPLSLAPVLHLNPLQFWSPTPNPTKTSSRIKI